MTHAEKQCRELWSKIVRHRDRWCILCGRTCNLEAHHIFPKSQGNWMVIFDVDYGITLCNAHHKPTPRYSDLFEKVVARIRQIDEARAEKILIRANTTIAPCLIPVDYKIVRKMLRLQWKEIEKYSYMDADCVPGPGDSNYTRVMSSEMRERRNEILLEAGLMSNN